MCGLFEEQTTDQQPPLSRSRHHSPFLAANNSLTITPQWHIIQSSAAFALLSDGCVMDSSQRGGRNAKNTHTPHIVLIPYSQVWIVYLYLAI